jgi:hypothetical protein
MYMWNVSLSLVSSKILSETGSLGKIYISMEVTGLCVEYLHIKGTVLRDFNSVFLTCIDRHRPEYELLIILKFL